MKMVGSGNSAKHVLVCGAGSIGERHIVNLLALGVNVSVWRSQSHLLKSIQDKFNVQVKEHLNDAIDDSDAVVVATASDNHIPIAIKVLQAGKALYIEKPLSHDWIDIDRFQRLALGRIVEVGCQFRTHQNLIALFHLLKKSGNDKILTYRLAMGHRLDAWRKGRDYQNSYSSDVKKGGGALFDLIHQIDIALWFFGPITEVSAILAKRGELNISGDDMANLLLTHSSGLSGHIQLDMGSPVYRCEAEVITIDSIFNWTYSDGTLHQRSEKGHSIEDQVLDGFERNDMFMRHMTHFLKRLVDHSLPPLCSIEDGIAALKVAICSREANESGKKIKI